VVKSSYGTASRASRYDLESSRSRSYSHSGLYDQGYRSRSSSVRDTSPYDPERDRDLVLSMRSQSAMSSHSRAASRDRATYATSTMLDSMTQDPMISTYSRSLTSDPLMTSSVSSKKYNTISSTSDVLGQKYNTISSTSDVLGLNSRLDSRLDSRLEAVGASSNDFSEATWLNDLRISAGMDPIPIPTSAAANKSLAYEAVSTMPRMLRSNSSQDLRAELEAMASAASSGSRLKTAPPTSRARHQTLAYGVSASDLNLRNSGDLLPAFNTTMLRNGSDNDIMVTRVPSREGEVYDVRGFESDMSAAIMNARVSIS
jgi:hypothetical protein